MIGDVLDWYKKLPKAEYTVYVIQDRAIYKTYLPTFYINKLMFKKADYFTLNENVENIVVNLRHFVLPTGTGKIFGNIFFETYSLKDSLLSTNGSSSLIVNTTAINTQVLLFDSNNEPVAWTITDQFGNYVFENIALDTYKVVAETASAYAESVVVLTDNSTVLNVDLLLKSQQAETGINDIENTEIKIYPNPVVDNLNIYSKEATTMELYNVLGKLLVRENLISGNNELDLSQISKGIYFTKIGKMTIKLVKK